MRHSVKLLVYVYLFLFFFKQKTAYEMRISDWSSDVCSSDLGEAVYNHCGLGRDQHVVFVRDVELVNAVEVMPSVLEGLYRIEDKCLDGRSWRASALFMSVKGGFLPLPVFVRSEERRGGKECVSRCGSGWSQYH